MKTAVVTDSTAYLPEEVRKELNIHMIPLNVIFGNESYQEEVEMKTGDFYDKIKHSEELPKTSQPAIGQFVDLFEKLAKDYDAIISIHLSSGISGTYQTALSAGTMVEGAEVYAYDSEISCEVQGFYVREAARLTLKGVDPQEIIVRLDEMKKSVRAYFMVDNLQHLQRGGRLSGTQAFVGSLLQVKPVLVFEDTKIVPYEKIRTEKKAVKRIKELFHEDAKDGAAITATAIHANRPEKAEALKKDLEKQYPNVEVNVSYFGPVIGTHLGEGSLGLGWYKK
ncbi:DegV family protein [Bacillus marinisedimentorum]|uniref:DegV family protein n=1 Tax=Bacillus marinisedimentorum TaxID=1821260 RepID=UPI0007E2028D|nr:DegV family protein [Bacillus marinisedimentorum]